MPKKIALISDHASPLADLGSVDSGGQNVYVAQVARQLAAAGYRVDIFTRRDHNALPEILEWLDGVRIIHVPAGPAEFVPKEELLAHMQAFTDYTIQFCSRQSVPYDLVHANFWLSGMVAVDVKRALGIPFVITFHALGRVRRQHQGKADGFPEERFQLEERIVAEADAIIAECPQDQEDLIRLYHAGPERITIIPCGFDPDELWPLDKTLSRQALHLPREEFLILQLGRMVPRKGVETVVRGLARLVKEHQVPARLLVVGGSSENPDPRYTPEIERLQAVAREEGIDDRVLFVGRRGREALKHYYSAVDVFVSVPWYEPFGITPVEAMACGTPVIGSNVGGIKSTVVDGETGFLIPPKDPGRLAEKLAYLYHHPEKLRELGEQAVCRANRHYTWGKVGALIAELYGRVARVEKARPQGLKQADPAETVLRGFDQALQALKKSRRVLSEPILAAAQAMVACLSEGGKVLVCGNGGSAADAQHFAAEFVGRFKYAERKALPVLALNADSAFLTAWANDVSYDKVFARQVEAFGQPGDLLLAISTSGRSRNLVEAFAAARQRGLTCLALLGGDGGELLSLSDLSIVIPVSNTARIQEVQILALHLLCDLVEEHFLPEGSLSETFMQREPLQASAASQSHWDLEPVRVALDDDSQFPDRPYRGL